MVVKLNLPSLPYYLKVKIRLISNLLALDSNPRIWLNEFHNHEVNSVNHNYVLTPELDTDILKIYQKYFTEPFVTMVGVQRNITNQLSTTPIHCDRGRNMAINYYLDLGGDNVQLCFYDRFREDQNLDIAENIQYQQEVSKLQSFNLEKDSWYAFNVQQSHAVENIETTRIFLSLVLKSNPSYENFFQIYQQLLTTDRLIVSGNNK
jgi:hypothetical protein